MEPEGSLPQSQMPATCPVKKLPAFYGTRRFITAITNACHLSLSWPSSIQSMPPNPTSWRPILILSSHLLLGLPDVLFPLSILRMFFYKTHICVWSVEIPVLYSSVCCPPYSCKQRAGPKLVADYTINKCRCSVWMGRVTFLDVQNRTVMNCLYKQGGT